MGLLGIAHRSAATHAAGATHAAAHSAHVTAEAASVAIGILVGEQDGVNQRVRALRRLDGSGQRQSASSVHAVGENDERLTALLLLHQFVRGKEDGVVERGASAPMVAA